MCDLMIVAREILGPFQASRPRLQWSFARLAAHLLNIKVDKGECLSNWEAPALSISQCRYAALDVHLIPFMHRMLKAIEPHLKLKRGPVSIKPWDIVPPDALGARIGDKRGRPTQCSVSVGGRVYRLDYNDAIEYVATSLSLHTLSIW